MPECVPRDVVSQYASSDPLQVRIRTHQLYGERRIDLDEICYDAFGLTGREAVLDAGCGPGRFLGYMRERGHIGELIELDQSAAMVAEVRRLGVEALRGDVQGLPFGTGSFDRVAARHMLYHVPDIALALSEFRRVLRPGGVLLVTTNSNMSMPGILQLIQDLLVVFEQPEWERPDDRFCIENAAGFFAAAGFRVEERVIENMLVFADPAPVVDYCVSTLPSLDVDPSLHDEMAQWLTAEAARRFDEAGGGWRDPTYAAVYVADAVE